MCGFLNKNYLRTGALLVTLGALLSTGCEQQVREMETARKRSQDTHVRDDVVDISQFTTMVPWRWDEEAGGVIGMNVRVYLVSAQTGRGTFVSGDLDVHLDVLTPKDGGSYVRQTVHSWTFTERDAYGFRVTNPSIMGASYGLILNWPPRIDVGGREVQLTFEYERANGQRIVRRGSRFKVPLPVDKVTPQPTPASQERMPRNTRIPATAQPAAAQSRRN